MATQIIISRIQNRRGRRENLPQPLRPGEIALTADTRQVWIGGDPALMIAGVLVYGDKDIATAQSIIDTGILEVRFNNTFGNTQFNAVRSALVNNGVVTIEEDDVLWDGTLRTNPPNSFEGYSVYVAADQGVDADNTLANIETIILGTSAGGLHISTNYVGDFVNFGGDFDEDGFLNLDTQGQATAIASLVNRVYAVSPSYAGSPTGLVTTNLNIEIGTGAGGGGFSGPVPYEIGFYLGGTTVTPDFLYSTYIAANGFEFLDGTTSQAYTNTVSASNQTFDLQRNGVSFGSVEFLTGNSTGSVVIPAPITFSPGDRLDIIGPAIPDGVITGIAITLSGLLQLA
jgi:hypothetical protein